MNKISRRMKSYLQLTKPSIMLLVLVTGATALVIEGSLLRKPIDAFLVLLGLFFSGGAANALNQYFERDIDAKMERTRHRRPLPLQTLTPKSALYFAIVIACGGVVLFATLFNALSAILALMTILFYGFFYTLYLKPNTPQNIVIGGAAGAMAPVIAWAAAAGSVSWTACLLFLIIFLWTPPHFWALALYLKDDYQKVALPMLPVIKGERVTSKAIFLYTILLVSTTVAMYWVCDVRALYLFVAIALGAYFLKQTWTLYSSEDYILFSRKIFRFSIVYLFGLFFAMVIDQFVRL